ncbi:MAG: hypothetical protein F4Y98_01465 [Chloroflexi bacterium]|nr:hypothetical protein [Chloroflexota bacterium]
MSTEWVQQLRALHDASFAADRDWSAHLQAVNQRLGLTGRRQLATPAPTLPPSWFVGDVEALQPGRWVLFVGLNQKRSPDDEAWHEAQNHSPQTYWDYWRWLNRRAWYAHFYYPRVRIAAAALDVAIPGERAQQQEFATTEMVCVEICPYSSEEFGLRDPDLLELLASDEGFRIASGIRHTFIEEAQPAFVLVAGNQAITVIEHADRNHMALGEPEYYPSVTNPERRLWHREGHLIPGASRVPVIACPALRTQSAHNSYDEIDQIGERARVLVRESRA